jgi:Bacterial membrane protein YfhO
MKVRTGQNCWAAVILVAILCLAFYDIVFLGGTFLTSNMQYGTIPAGAYGYTGPRVRSSPIVDSYASAFQFEPYVKVLHDDMAHHWLPLWDPYVGSGAPLLANMAPAVFSPMRLILASVNKPAFWDVYLLLRLFLAAFFTYLFAREVGIGFTGSLVAGIAFGLSGHFIYFINMADLDTQMWLPAFLLATHKLASKPTYSKFAVTAALVALIILAGMPESALFIFLLGTLYLLFRLWKFASDEQREEIWCRKPQLGFIAAGFVGLLISLPQVLPFAEFLRNAFNPRAPGVGMRYISAGTAPSLIMPSFFGHLYSTWNGVDPLLILPYIGTVCFLFALAGMCRKGSWHRLTLFFVGFAIFYLLKSFGIPPVQWVGRLPLFSMSIFPKHAFPEFAFCMAVLAGMGADCILKNEVNYSRFLLACILLVLTVGGFAAYYWNEAAHSGGLYYVTESCVIFDLTFGLVWLLGMAARRFAPSRIIPIALVLLPAVELIAFIPRNRTARYDSFTKPPFVDFLRGDRQPYRTFSIDHVLFPNTNAAYGIDDIRTLDPLQVSRYIDFLRADFGPAIYDRFDASEVSRKIINSPLLDLLNVKYVLANPGPVLGYSSDKFELVYDGEVRIYRNKNALPRAFVVGHAEVVPDKNQILAKLTEADFNPKENVILEENVTNNAELGPAASSPVTFERYEPNYIGLQAELTRPGWLVLTDTYFPGWKVLIDGKAGRILPADYIFRAVPLDSGSHIVEFVYRPPSFVWGVAISMLTIGLLSFVPLMARRRTPEKKSGSDSHLTRLCTQHDQESTVV